MKKTKVISAITAAMCFAGLLTITASADVSGAISSTWTTAKLQIQNVVNTVVFPVIDVILSVLLFVKIGTAYLECAPVKADY